MRIRLRLDSAKSRAGFPPGRVRFRRLGPVLLGAPILLLPLLGVSQTKERFPKPDFQSGYTRPNLITPAARSPLLEYLDVAVLLAALTLATALAHKQRSRRKIFRLMVFSLVYFGFYRKGCVCAVGSIQNVALGLFQSGYAVPLTVVAFFVLPLVFALFYGRTFCAAVCPLGAVQDAVILRPVRVPDWLARILELLPYVYLGLAVLFAATGAGFVICQFDPFVGFFRFGAAFDMVILGVSMLILGTVVARPYCRFLCPYGVLLNWASRLSRRHVTITPTECNNCRLCEESCPFGAIQKPSPAVPRARAAAEIKRIALLLVLLPVLVGGTGWIGSRLHVTLAKLHPAVSLAEEILTEDAAGRPASSDATRAFRATGKTSRDLFVEASALQRRFRTGGWILGGFLGLVLCLKLVALTGGKRRPEYGIETGACLSCGRCFSYCPYEKVRLGLIRPEDIPQPETGLEIQGET